MLSKRKKYSLKLKLEIVQKYLWSNQSLGDLAKEYYVSKGDIQK